VFFQACGAPRGMKARVPGPPTVTSSSIEGGFATQHVADLVAVAVKVERRIGADRCGFLEEHDAVAALKLLGGETGGQ
jgi:hypothetical protein